MISWEVFRWPHWVQLLASLALGGLTVLAFAPFGLGLLVLFSMAGLLHLLWHVETPRHAARIGFAFGLGLMGFGVFWLRISINQFGGVTPALAVTFTTLFVALIALYFALAGWLLKRLAGGRPRWVFMLLAAPAAWWLVEWFRGWLLTGFPWLSLGYSQIDLPLAGYVPLVGVYGVGALLVLSAGLLNMWKSGWPSLLLLAIWAGGLTLSWQDWTAASGEQIRVSLVQGNIAQQDKWKRHLFASNLRLYRELTEQVPDSALVVWPETAIAAFDDEIEDSVLQPLHALMAGQDRDLITGIVSREEDGRYYNAMITLGASGRYHYHKRHLVPFGEYLPFKPLLDPVLGFLEIPMSDFSPGNGSKPLVPLAGTVAGVNICYEDAFASEVLRALPEAGFLINASNDAWFGDSLAPHQHLQIARMRALEAGRYLLRATNTGISAIINTRGELRGTAPQFEQAVLTDLIQPMQGMTPYTRWGDWPLLVMSLLVLLGLLRLPR
jgi:apolipoprotein N-acyltransferase